MRQRVDSNCKLYQFESNRWSADIYQWNADRQGWQHVSKIKRGNIFKIIGEDWDGNVRIINLTTMTIGSLAGSDQWVCEDSKEIS